MTDKGLFWFKCSRCNKDIMRYLDGRYEWRQGDLFFVPHDYEEFRAYRNDIRDFDIGNYFHPITTINRLCNTCSKGMDILSFGNDTNPYIDTGV